MASPKENGNVGKKIAKQYMLALKTNPLLTKSCTSAVLSGIGNIIAQWSTKEHVDLRSVFAYSATGFFYVAPTMHVFYRWLEKTIPSGTKWSAVMRIILDRYIMAPPWLLVFFYVLSILEGLGHKGAIRKIQETFWEILKTNWKVWTVFQFVNVNYVPQQFRVLFASLLAFFWNIYVATARK